MTNINKGDGWHSGSAFESPLKTRLTWWDTDKGWEGSALEREMPEL